MINLFCSPLMNRRNCVRKIYERERMISKCIFDDWSIAYRNKTNKQNSFHDVYFSIRFSRDFAWTGGDFCMSIICLIRRRISSHNLFHSSLCFCYNFLLLFKATWVHWTSYSICVGEHFFVLSLYFVLYIFISIPARRHIDAVVVNERREKCVVNKKKLHNMTKKIHVAY